MVVYTRNHMRRKSCCSGYYEYRLLAVCFSWKETGGFGGGKVENQDVETSTKPNINGDSQGQSGNGGENKHSSLTRKERRVSRAAVVEPLFFSLIFCTLELIVPVLHASAEDLASGAFYLKTLWEFVDTFIGYFAATLISMVVFMFLQQYYYKCFAGIEDDKAVFPLATVFVLYLIFYVVYLTIKHVFVKWLLLGLTVLAAFTVWTSLRKDVQKIEKATDTNGYNSSVFTNSDSLSQTPKEQAGE